VRLARKLAWLFLAGLLAVSGAAAWTAYELQRTLVLAGETALVRVSAGSSARTVAADLLEAGVPLRKWEFVLAASVTHSTRSLRAGRYRIEHETNLLALLDKFRRGDVERVQVTIVDGTRFADLRQQIAQSPELRHDTVQWSDAQILQALGAQEGQPEGLFGPDSYTIDPEASDLELYRLAYRKQRERLEHAWQSRDPDLPYPDAYQALIMASIIEKETGKPSERGLVAAVFVNRLRLGMALQTDPTVIYGLGDGYDGRLHKRDLLRDTPYNTYTRAGLPPTPISLPGRDSIEAALHPDPSRVLYFVARGDGSSEFSATLADHNRAVDRYQRNSNHRDPRSKP
jgi:UPF0755 protein